MVFAGSRCARCFGLSPLKTERSPPHRAERVTEATLEEFSDAMVAGWGSESEVTRAYQRAAFESSTHQLYLVRRSSRVAGGAVSVCLPRSVHLSGGIILPEFRGQGAYRELVRIRLADAVARGLTIATTHAMEATSAPLLEHFGFQTHHRFTMYRSPPGGR